LHAAFAHQHFQRRRGSAAGRGDVLAQRRRRKIRAGQQFAGAGDGFARELCREFLGQAGQVAVSRADQNETKGVMTTTLTNVKFVEWDFNADNAVANGACYIIGGSLDAGWDNPVDGGSDGGTTDGGTTDGGSGCHVVINEVQVAGSGGASDEFVEIFNPCSASVNMNGWKLMYRSASNNSVTLATLTETIVSNGYVLIGGSGYTGTATADQTENGGMAAGGGAVGVTDGSATLIDSVSYGTLSVANAFTETAPAAAPPSASSIARSPNGNDTNNNSTDFVIRSAPTPKAANP